MIKSCYKKDSKGRIRVTHFKVEGSDIITMSGLLNGKLKETVIPCKPKNIGRSNETTAEQQALLELESRYKKKLDEGHFPTLDEAENSKVLLPMLAHSVKLNKLVYPVIVSPKLDGMRAMGNNTKIISRKGKEVNTLPHIVLPDTNGAWLDGELYAHGKDFQTNMSLIKKYRKGLTEDVKYHVYDIYIPNGEHSYIERHKELSKLCCGIDNVEVVPYKLADSEEELIAVHKEYLSLGYEGTMVRVNGVPYELNKRSHSLLKYKDFIDEVYEIIDIVPNDKTPTHGTIVCELGGITFKCGMKMSHEAREEMLLNRDSYIGKQAEVRFFEYSNNGVPRFPVCVGIRNDK